MLDCLFGIHLTCVDARVANLGMPKSVSLRTHSCTLCANLSSGVHLEMMQLVKWMCLKWNRFTYTYWGGSEFIFQIFCPPLIWRIHLYFHEVVILDYKIHIWNIETVVWLTLSDTISSESPFSESSSCIPLCMCSINWMSLSLTVCWMSSSVMTCGSSESMSILSSSWLVYYNLS